MSADLFPEGLNYYRRHVVDRDLGDLLTVEQLAALFDAYEKQGPLQDFIREHAVVVQSDRNWCIACGRWPDDHAADCELEALLA